MKPDTLWAMYDSGGTLVPWAVRPTRQKVISLVQNHYGTPWRYLRRRFGYRLDKVVVLRAAEYEQLLEEVNHE